MFDLLQQPFGVKMNRDICIENQPIYSGLFLVFACYILKNQLPNGLLNLSKRASSHKNV